MSDFLTDDEMDKMAGVAPASSGFLSDDDIDKMAAQGVGVLRKTGQAIMGGVGAISNKIDSYTGAPIRAGVSTALAGGDLTGSLEAAKNQFGEDPSTAPTGKDIAEQVGVPGNPEINTHLNLNPFTGETLKVTPSGVVGAVADTALDPTTYLGEGLVAGAKKLAPEVAAYLEEIAANRAVKATTGNSRANINTMVRAPVKGGDVESFEKMVADRGGQLVKSDAAGPPAIGYGSNYAEIGKNAADKRDFYGDKIGQVGTAIDKQAPNSVNGNAIAQKMLEYASNMSEMGKGEALQERVLREAQKFERKGQMGFAEAQLDKNQYKYAPDAQDALISDKDVTNALNRIVSGEMDSTAAHLSGKVDPELLGQYQDFKDKYGLYVSAAASAADANRNAFVRRMASPSSHGLGIGAGLGVGAATMAATHSVPEAIGAGLLTGATTAGANMMALGRGPALAARSANAVASVIQKAPQFFGPWMTGFQQAAAKGPEALNLYHHILMQNDPDYFSRFNQASGGQQ